jgi:outer membrane receptor protein involved in Fe transport
MIKSFTLPLQTLLIAAFLLPLALAAQNATLTGKITDALTGDDLPGVTIKAGSKGTASDATGNYTLQLEAGPAQVSFTYTGYEAKNVQVRLAANETKTLDVQLGDANNLLQQATVTAGKFEKALGEVTVSMDVLKPRIIESVNSTSVDEALVKVPGLNIVDGQASIRGGAGFSYGAGTRVLMLLDDIPALQPDAGLPNWDDFPVENIAQVEVIKGAASALYGSSAMNGIINLRTGYAKDKPETSAAIFGKTWGSPADERQKWWAEDTSSVQQPVETGFNFLHRRKAGKFDFVFGSYGMFRDSYNKFNYNRYMRVSPNVRYRVNDRLSLGLNTNFNFGRSGSFFTWANDSLGAYLPGAGAISRTLGRLRFNIDPNLQYFDKAGNRHKILTRYFYVHNRNSSNQSNDSRLMYGEYQFQRQMTRIGLVFTAGAVGMTTRIIESAIYNGASYDSRNAAVYAQFDYKPIERLNLSGGWRWERNLQNSPELIPALNGGFDTIPDGRTTEAKPVFRFGANYRVALATYLRASWGQAYRYPTIAEKFVSTSFSGNLVNPNGKLRSETGWSAELGLKQGFKIGGWQGFVDVAGFVQEYENMMEFVFAKVGFGPTGIVATFQSQNQGNTRITGGEISVMGQGRLGPGEFFVLTGFTGLNPRYKKFERTSGYDPNVGPITEYWGSSDTTRNVLKYRFRNTFKWDGEYVLNKFSLGTSVIYYSHMEAIDRVFEEFLPGIKSFRNKHNSGSTLVDIRASYRLTSQLKLSAIVGNLFNEVYTIRPAMMEAPRNFTVRLDWKM